MPRIYKVFLSSVVNHLIGFKLTLLPIKLSHSISMYSSAGRTLQINRYNSLTGPYNQNHYLLLKCRCVRWLNCIFFASILCAKEYLIFQLLFFFSFRNHLAGYPKHRNEICPDSRVATHKCSAILMLAYSCC